MAILKRTTSAGIAALVMGLAGDGLVSEAASLETDVEANYLYKFTPFVEWPASTFPRSGSPLNICIVGEDPFGRDLDEAIGDQRIDGHPIVVRRLAAATPAMNCHVMFAGRSASQKTSEMLRLASGQPILTVTDESQSATPGMIQFVLSGGHVRFRIDAAAAQASGLKISSKLLGLALPALRPAR